MSVALRMSEGDLLVAMKASAPAARSRSPLAAGLRSQLSLIVHRRALRPVVESVSTVHHTGGGAPV